MQNNAALVDEHSSPLDAEQAGQLSSLIQSLSANQATWVSGYLAGLNARTATDGIPAATVAPAAQPQTSESITVLYGSQTGNSEGIAEQFAAQAAAAGLTAHLVDMLDYKPRDLKKEKNVVICVATHGEGDPPDNAEELHAFIFGKKAPRLEGVRFSVLAFGDSSYENFCQTGRDFDTRLEELGATRLAERVDLDVDFDDPAETWVSDVVARFKDALGATQPTHAKVTVLPGMAERSVTSQWSRKNPYATELLTNVVLNGRGSEKEVHHIELDTEDSGLIWEPGDSLGIIPVNAAHVVSDLIQALGASADDPVEGLEGPTTLEHALTHQYEITTLTRPVIEKYAERAGHAELSALLADNARQALSEYIEGRHLIDLIEDYPAADLDTQGLLGLLRKLPTRLYSIASSHTANPDEIHLTVAAVRYQAHGRNREGVTSIQLADRSDDTQVQIYVDHNKNFKLPADEAPIIMIGPGTGVAPFRAFLEERDERGASGDNWLFFGAQHFRTDFYYQMDWLRWRKSGLLTRMDAAFSRDQDHKIYVQDKLREAGAEVFRWLERGAALYVCGDADAMAADVHSALLDIIAEHGARSPEEAAVYLKSLQKEKRYQRDVY